MKNYLIKFAEVLPIKPVGDGSNDFEANLSVILNSIIGILGFVCVVVIIIGGVNYMTSTGEASKVKKAKDTILYGLIGLVVCALAAALVNFVLLSIIGGGK